VKNWLQNLRFQTRLVPLRRGSPSGSIKPGDALIFTIEIVQVSP
jgi:hypothetical protein